MALPPEQINIKRRREEEPVETLYIQSALHQTKRRFTDYVFQRVPIKAGDGDAPTDAGAPTTAAAQRLLRSPRSVSSLHVNRRAPQQSTTPTPGITSSGVPLVRRTSPGAELRDAQRRAAALKEADEKRKQALQPSPLQPSPAQSTPQDERRTPATGTSGSGASSSRDSAIRRFQISKANSPALRAAGGGIQKRRPGAPPGVAVLVEQLQRNHSRKASMVDDLVCQAELDDYVNVTPPSEPAKPRKRPVVNQAEKKWREERKKEIAAAKQHISEGLENTAKSHQSTWEEESDRLAKEFESIALEIENGMELDPSNGGDALPGHEDAPAKSSYSRFSQPASLKYQPRFPNKLRARASDSNQPPAPEDPTETDGADTQAVDDNDGDFVYDVYIRRPLTDNDKLTNPLAEFESDKQLKELEAAANAGVGVIVITEEDEEYWDHFIEDDEEEWDSEDADSNGEFQPDLLANPGFYVPSNPYFLLAALIGSSIANTLSLDRLPTRNETEPLEEGWDNTDAPVAENNPANDYPEEEFSTGDEEDDPTSFFGRRHIASDDEEFDIDDSDIEGGARLGSTTHTGYGGYLFFGRSPTDRHVDSDDESV
ncbi:hypothetical protein N7532_003275 [Penicillium argentinense]|uniref:Transcription factor Iwr1 domain-containing protein n=1 Tax=Penicillium argentinense TaxID=1131581 RepID=A0A9W9FM42_9EURO|nr:uncharacterized protein N7532_003275 [Penicillium argentinense]KAJ5102746.1 hypothetical protein N7532_003275 [Penicillium argentinense]